MRAKRQINLKKVSKYKQSQSNRSSNKKQLPQRNISSNTYHRNSSQIKQKQRCFLHDLSEQTKINRCSQQVLSRLVSNRNQKLEDLRGVKIKKAFRHPGKFIKNCMIELYVISKIENNQTFRCYFLIFHIGFLLILSSTLAVYETTAGQLYIHDLFKMEIKTINFLKSRLPKQVEEIQCINAIATALTYRNGDTNIAKIKRTLKQFLKRHETKMITFMPVYYAYFKLISDKQELLSANPTINEVQKLIHQTQQGFKKLHNDRY